MAPKQNKGADKAKLANKQKVAMSSSVLCRTHQMNIHSLYRF